MADHVVRVSETVDSLDVPLSTAFDAYLALGAMLVASVALYRLFKRSGWL